MKKACLLISLCLLAGCQEEVPTEAINLLKEGTAIVKTTCVVMASQPDSAELCDSLNIEDVDVVSKVMEATKVYREEKAKFQAIETMNAPLPSSKE